MPANPDPRPRATSYRDAGRDRRQADGLPPRPHGLPDERAERCERHAGDPVVGRVDDPVDIGARSHPHHADPDVGQQRGSYMTEGGGEPERPRTEPAHRERGDGRGRGQLRADRPGDDEPAGEQLPQVAAHHAGRTGGQQPGVWRPHEPASGGDRRHRREVRARQHDTEPDRPPPVHSKRSERQAGHPIRVATRPARPPPRRRPANRIPTGRKAEPATRTAPSGHADESHRARCPCGAPRARPAVVRARRRVHECHLGLALLPPAAVLALAG